jgi:hypothetical protein
MTAFNFRQAADYALAAIVAVTATSMLFATSLVQSVPVA